MIAISLAIAKTAADVRTASGDAGRCSFSSRYTRKEP